MKEPHKQKKEIEQEQILDGKEIRLIEELFSFNKPKSWQYL